MLRDIFTNKWILGMIALLIIIVGGCLLWYEHTTSPYETEAAKTAEYTRQMEKNRQAKTESSTDTETAALQSHADSKTQSEDRQRTNVNPVTDKIAPPHAQNETESPSETAETAELKVSPHGFGPYPEVPEDLPYRHLYTNWGDLGPQSELLNRVLIKLWASGEKNFIGGSTYKGKVYPHYNDAVYVKWGETVKNGKKVRTTAIRISGPHVPFNGKDLLNPPPGLRVLDLESSGIYPYEYLDLP